jgi:hypothetical protein
MTGLGRFLSVTSALHLAAGLGITISVLLLITALQNPDGFDYGPAWFVFLSLALTFYAALGIGALRLSRTVARRRWLVACTVASGMIAIGGGGIGSLIVFGPSTAILLWLAIRG